MNEVKSIKISDLISAPNNPFKVTLDVEMERLIESIAETGIIAPIIVRPTKNGKYEIVSGHRRKYACEYLGIESIPTIVKELDRNEAVIFLVDSNLQRENILPSEKAFAYKLKAEALSHQGYRADLTSAQLAPKLATEQIADDVGTSKDTIKRYIRLTNLIPELLQYVDDGKIAFTPAVELSYLNEQEQRDLLEQMEINDCTPSLSQACRFKKVSLAEGLTPEFISAVMSEEKANQKEMFKVPMERIRKFAPKGDTKAVEEFVLKACEHYRHYLNRKRERDR